MRYIFGLIAILCTFSLTTNILSYPIEISHHFPSKESNGPLVIYNNKDRGFSFSGGFTLDFDWSISNPFTISNSEFTLTRPQIGFPRESYTTVDVAFLSSALLGSIAGAQWAEIISENKKKEALDREINEANARIAQKKKNLRRKLREYLCSQK